MKLLRMMVLAVLVVVPLLPVNQAIVLAHQIGGGGTEAYVSPPVTPGVSPPLREIPTLTTGAVSAIHISELVPRQQVAYGMPEIGGDLAPQIVPQAPSDTPSPLRNFDGLSLLDDFDVFGKGGVPPDTVGDVGPQYYIQMVNSIFAIYNKDGSLKGGPWAISSLWPDSDTTKCKTNDDGDPIVLYDPLAQRWMLSQFGVTDSSGDTNPPYYQCIAVSKTSDPTGEWYTYSFLVKDSGSQFNDYGKFAVWPDGYYMGANESYFTAYVFERVKMLNGQAATFQKFNIYQRMMLPSDLDGSTPPPSGSKNYFYTIGPNNIIELWGLHVDWTTPANSSFTRIKTLTSSGYIYDVCPADPGDKSSWECIPQPGTTQAVDAIGEWPMYRFQYRNHGSHETLVGNFTVDTNSSDSADHAAPHWFELRRVGGGEWTIYDEGTISPDTSLERWMGSAAMDKDGNIAVGYSASSSSVYPSIRYVTRLASDPKGSVGSEVTLYQGAASQSSVERWGDYSAMAVDPSDDCTFWYTNEYIKTVAPYGGIWHTRIGSFKIPSCGAAPSPDLGIAKSVSGPGGSTLKVPLGSVVTYTIALSNDGEGDATGVAVGDALPLGVDFDAWVLQNGAQESNNIIIWTGAISAQQQLTIAFTAQLTTTTTFTGHVIVNKAVFTSTNAGGGSAEASFSVIGAQVLYLPLITRNH